LWILHEDEAVAHLERAEVLLGRRAEDVGVLARHAEGLAVERIVELLRHREERLAAAEHVPARIHPDLAQERDEPAQDLGHPAPDRRRVDVLDRSAAQTLAEEAQLLDGGGPHERGVRIQGGGHGSSRDRRRWVIIPTNRWRRPSAV